MQKVTAVIITYNEEKTIGRCLESLNSVADEIIVIDSFSTDQTKQVCAWYPIRFFENKFEGYIEQKNFGNSLSTHDYILSLDADEALSPELQNSLNEWKMQELMHDAYIIHRKNNYCGKWIKHSGWYPDKSIRLFNKTKGQWGGPTPHEYVVMNQGSSIERLNGDILHWSYETLREHQERSKHYAELAAIYLHQKGVKVNAVMICVKPIFRFIKHYFIKMGFLDGKAGYQISKISAWEVYYKYKKLRQLYR